MDRDDSQILNQEPPTDEHGNKEGSDPSHGLEPSASEVTESLKHILESAFFRSSKRGKEFLSFVVKYRLENHPEPLKERIIGVALFHRSIDYVTGDDSVVRAQAREVRRRLEKYYGTNPQTDPIRIELPVGSYSPEFRRLNSPGIVASSSASESRSLLIVSQEVTPALSLPSKTAVQQFWNRRTMLLMALVLVVALLGVALGANFHRPSISKSPISQFWAPAYASTKPLLICLPKPVFYRPSAELYKRSAQRPGEFDHEVDRMNHSPQLHSEDTIHWGDMVQYFDYGISAGDVQAAVRISNFLGHQGKDSEVRIGNGYSSADLRNSPAIVVGAFSNPWTMEMTSSLPFAFVDDPKGLRIQEQGSSGRSWSSKHGAIGEDYGLVTRLVDSSTGQFVVLVAGIEASGSDAAADLVVDPDGLAKALHGESKDWPSKNIQILVSTSVKDSVAGPPKVISVHVW